MEKGFLKCLALCLLLSSYTAFAQVGVNTTNPHASAALDITSSTKGLLIPRVDSAARVGMTGMANSLLVFDTTKKLFFYYQAANNTWYALNAWQSSVIENGGNTDTITTTFSKVGIGTNAPAKKLDVIGNIGATTTITAGQSVSAPKIYGEGTMPPGAIIMWSSSPTTLPVGWALCDGTNGTPNLSGRFIVGYDAANPNYNNLTPANRVGGNTTVTIQNQHLPVVSPWTLLQTPHNHKGQHAVVAWQPDNTGQWADNIGDGGDPNWRATTLNTQLVADAMANVSIQNNTGGGQPMENRPPYYMLAYIMKLTY